MILLYLLNKSFIIYLFVFISTSSGVIKSLDHTKYTLVSSTISIKHDKMCKEYLNVHVELSATGRVFRYVRTELSATGRAVHGPSCLGIIGIYIL